MPTRIFILILTLITVSSCQTADRDARYQVLRNELNARFPVSYVESQPYNVLYVTNRAARGATGACSNAVYGVAKGSDLHFGLCRVQVPINRPVGSLSSGTDPNADTQINFQMAQHQGLNADAFALALKSPEPDEILIFVHGFNVRFEEAVYRAAQIGFDGKYQGQLVLFSWPAGAVQRWIEGPYLYRTYQENKRNAAGSIQAFEELLTMVAAAGKRVHVVVHSMGHQVVLPALARAADKLPVGTIQELVLNAPDFSTQEFKSLLPAIRQIAVRTTVYCSPSDNALAASTRVNGNARLGSCTLMDGIDTIDVSEVDQPIFGLGGLGHGYYAGRPIIGDVSQLLLGMEAPRRMFIKRTVPQVHSNYRLRP
ncbi:alpha/beta hydrolase [Oligoflexus tunisiensis]|uniref:alpha/beta hydrolase n=1 Tax=Oligoflexus tunisiensis TaxID=708132 RepID=UPI000B0C57B3|nr:alpha/beta hydrolase [Oligoflexus tunisiensis]